MKGMKMLPLAMRRLYKRLNSPAKVQTFISDLPANFELSGETYMSPLRTLREQRAHCMEGAMLAASIFRFHGRPPLLMDLRAKKPDQDHVVALFEVGGYWGAISKTNHAVLRYREPIYKTLRELALSYFHEYIDNATGRKNLREYSVPVNLRRFEKLEWETTEDDLWEIVSAVDDARHFNLVTKKQEQLLRLAERVEVRVGEIVEWKKNGRRVVG
jgi:hypothetical protein